MKPAHQEDFDFLRKNAPEPHQFSLSEKFASFFATGFNAVRSINYFKTSIAVSALLVSGFLYNNGSDWAQHHYAQEQVQQQKLLQEQHNLAELQKVSSQKYRQSLITSVSNISEQEMQNMLTYIHEQKIHNDEVFNKAVFVADYLYENQKVKTDKNFIYERKGSFDRWMDDEAKSMFSLYQEIKNNNTDAIDNDKMKKLTDWYNLYKVDTIKPDFKLKQKLDELMSRVNDTNKFESEYATVVKPSIRKPKM